MLLLGEDQAWTDYGFMGHPEIKTPNLDQLAAKSLVARGEIREVFGGGALRSPSPRTRFGSAGYEQNQNKR